MLIAGQCAWLLEIAFVHDVCVCMHICVRACMRIFMCPSPKLLIISDVMFHYMDPYYLLNKFCNIYMMVLVSIITRCDLRNEAHHRNPNKSKLLLYKPLFSH